MGPIAPGSGSPPEVASHEKPEPESFGAQTTSSLEMFVGPKLKIPSIVPEICQVTSILPLVSGALRLMSSSSPWRTLSLSRPRSL
jgi:hypothetical protein